MSVSSLPSYTIFARFQHISGRCRTSVDPMLGCDPKLVAIDEEANHQIVHRRRFGKANRATHETLDPGPQIDVFALDFLCILLANVMLLWVDMPLVGPPPIGVKPRDTKRLQQRLSVAERPHPCVAQKRRPTRSHCGDRSHATTTAAPLSCPRNSTSHRALTSVRNAAPALRRDRSRTPHALGVGASPPPDAPERGAAFFSFLDDRAGADVQHPHRIANPTGIHGHVDDLALHLGVTVLQRRSPRIAHQHLCDTFHYCSQFCIKWRCY